MDAKNCESKLSTTSIATSLSLYKYVLSKTIIKTDVKAT